MTAFQAIAYILGNAYGALGPTESLLVFLQLFMSGIIVILMDELIQKGWGLGSGVSLFIMTNVAGQVLYNSLNFIDTEIASPAGYMGGAANENPTNLPKGIIAAMISNLLRFFGVGTIQGDPVDAGWFMVRNGFDPSMLSLIVTFVIFGAVIWMESVRVEIPLQYAKYRGMKARYPIKLLYTSNIPVISTQTSSSLVRYCGDPSIQMGQIPS
ncbi:MAG: hypothetical protein ACW99G_10390 [Candidatus Thorarchaeota archaeon]|jgi:preprotein translocase subunit SecY